MLFLFNLLSLIVFSYGKAIDTVNGTSTVPMITSISTSPVPTTTTTIFITEPPPTTTTTINIDEQTTIEIPTTMITTTTNQTNVNVKPYEYQSNFSRSNDSVFVFLHANRSDLLYSINNTFQHPENHSSPVEIQLDQHTILSDINYYFTKIRIYFNGTLTRDLAGQIGGRLMDFADLLSEMHLISNQTDNVDLH